MYQNVPSFINESFDDQWCCQTGSGFVKSTKEDYSQSFSVNRGFRAKIELGLFRAFLDFVPWSFFRDYSDVPEVFERIKSVASSKIVDQVKAIYLFNVDRKLL